MHCEMHRHACLVFDPPSSSEWIVIMPNISGRANVATAADKSHDWQFLDFSLIPDPLIHKSCQYPLVSVASHQRRRVSSSQSSYVIDLYQIRGIVSELVFSKKKLEEIASLSWVNGCVGDRPWNCLISFVNNEGGMGRWPERYLLTSSADIYLSSIKAPGVRLGPLWPQWRLCSI